MSMGGSPNLCEAEGKVRVGPARCGQMAGQTESNQGGGCEKPTPIGTLRQVVGAA